MGSAYSMARGGVRAAKHFHLALLVILLRTPLTKLDTIPVGRCLNRFSDDMSTIDLVVPFTVRSMLNCTLGCCGSVLVMGVVTPYILVAFLPLAVIYTQIQVCTVLTMQGKAA